MVFSWPPLPHQGSSCKAQNAAGLVALRVFATPQMLPWWGNPKGKSVQGSPAALRTLPMH